MPKSYTTQIALAGLTLGIIALLLMVVMFPIAFNTLGGSTCANGTEHVFIQSGNVTFDIYYNSAVIDTVNTTYQLYDVGHIYELNIDPIPRELTIPPGAITSSSYVKLRLHYFSPTIIPLNAAAWYELTYSLTPPNVDAIIPQGPCFDSPATCILVGWGGNGYLTQNSFGTDLEGSPTVLGYYFFYMQPIPTTPQDWTNYTINIASSLSLAIYGA